jgi:hypothetical protein
MRLCLFWRLSKKRPVPALFVLVLLRSGLSMSAYLCQQPYPRDEGAVEDVRPSAAATGGDVLVSSHWFEQREEKEKK